MVSRGSGMVSNEAAVRSDSQDVIECEYWANWAGRVKRVLKLERRIWLRRKDSPPLPGLRHIFLREPLTI